MVECNVRTASFISAGVQMAVSLIVTILFIYILVVTKDEKRKAEFDFLRYAMRTLWYCLIANIVAIAASILLIVGIKKSNTKFMSFFFWPTGAIMVGWTFLSIYSLISNLRSNNYTVGSAILEFLVDLVLVVIEIVIIIPVYRLYHQLKRNRPNPYMPHELQNLNRNGQQKPSFQS